MSIVIGPNAAKIKINHVKRLAATNISYDPKWGIRSGVGTVNSFGSFSSTEKGDSVVRAMSEMWETHHANLLVSNNNDLLVAENHAALEATSLARLNGPEIALSGSIILSMTF